MHDLPGLVAHRLGLDSGDVAVFRQPEISEHLAEDVRTGGRDLVRREPHNQIRLANLPRVRGREFGRRGRVGRVALRRAAVHPLDDRRDLVVGQRRVVEETLNPDVAVQMPRRHRAGLYLVLDRAGPRTHVLVADQRHRCDLTRAVARDTRVVEDRRNVVGKRRLGWSLRGCASRQ